MSDAPRRKLIEVALPLDAINDASAYDKLPGIGPHPKGLHKWWAPLPLPCARAVLFASLIDDPSESPERFPTDEDQERERERLFSLIRKLVKRRAERDAAVFSSAREELGSALPADPPAILDPFCGSGAIPLEAQRLGLRAYARDLNPVAVLLTRALIDIPARFAHFRPVNPTAASKLDLRDDPAAAAGLAADVRFYGRWMLDRARQEAGATYPSIAVDGRDRTVIAWIWCRTAKCPNPACGGEMPLISSYLLSNVRGKRTWLRPEIDHAARSVRFEIETGGGQPPDPPKVGRGGSFRCVFCGEVAGDTYMKDEGKAGRFGTRLVAIVAGTEGAGGGRIYQPADDLHESLAKGVTRPDDAPAAPLADDPRNIWCKSYGFVEVADLFTPRQLSTLSRLSDLVQEAHARVEADARESGMVDDGVSLASGGQGARAYADAVSTYLAFAVDRAVDFNNSLCRWVPGNEKVMNLFSRQAIPVVWDYAEANILEDVVGGFGTCCDYVADCLETVIVGSVTPGEATQADARHADGLPPRIIVSTDPPYYDNIAYSDLSDVFYVWLRRSLRAVHPDLLNTLLTPKQDELVATPYRFDGNRDAARNHFESGFLSALKTVGPLLHEEYPLTVYYAFKQSEGSKPNRDASAVDLTTGWETMLQALIDAGLQITATWPVRASQNWRMIAMGTNALASYIVLVCRPRRATAGLATRKELTAALRAELPAALRRLQSGSIAPVDLAQAAIGPGMAVFSRYSKVVEADGRPMRVRTALTLINEALDELLAEQEADFDADTRWCVAWFEQYGMSQGPYGVAETLSRAKNTAINGLADAGVIHSRGGKVHLLDRSELDGSWDPTSDPRLTVWEVTQHLISRHQDQGEEGAASLLRQVGGGLAEAARELAYRLFAICERKGWAQEALAYNALVTAWPEITRLAARTAGAAAGAQEAMEV